MRKIIGQCHKSDFNELMHLAELMARGEEVYLDNLTNRQKVAVRVIDHFLKRDIPLKTLDKIKTVLVWDMGNGRVAFEYKLMDRRNYETARLLRSYR